MKKHNHLSVVEKPKTLENKLFHETYKEEVSKLVILANLNMPPDITLPELVEATQPWAKGDHYDPKFPINQSPEQMEQSIDIFNNLGMIQEIEPQVGEYGQILILGGEQHSNHIRMDFTLGLLNDRRISLSENGSIVCLGGDRMLKARELGAVGKDIERIINNPDLSNAWSRQLLRSEMLASLDEEVAMRIALTARIGSLHLIEKHLRLNSESLLSHNVYSGTDLIPQIVTVFAPKVNRPLGDPRHTTESTVIEWLKGLSPKMGSRVLFVSNAPYTIRTARNFYTTVKSLRPDLDLSYCGAEAADDDLLSRRCYGELARLLYDNNQ